MKNALFQNKRQLAPVSFVTGLFLLLTVLVNPLIVSATSQNTAKIPYNVLDYRDQNSYIDDSIIQIISDKMYQDFNLSSSDSILMFTPDFHNEANEWDYNIVYVLSNPYFNGTISSDFDYLNDSLTIYGVKCQSYEFRRDGSVRGPYGMADNSGFSLLGNATTYDVGGFGLCRPRYPFFYNGFGVLSSNDLEVIISRAASGPSVIGHATAPDPTTSFLGNNADFGASIFNSTFPNVPTVSHYSPNTYNPPAIDNSSVTSLLESLIDIIQYNLTYIINSIQGFVTSIITTVESFGKYIGSIIAYVGKAIITNIQYAIQNLFENLVSLFEPILNFISEVLSGIKSIVDEIISLGTDENGNFSLTTLFVNLAIPSESDLQEAVSDSDTFGLISVASSVNTKILTEVNTLKGLSSSKIIHVPSCFFHGVQIGDYDIDFSWYDNYKSLGDGIISAFLIWNYIWFLFFRLPSFIRGQGGAFVSDVNSSVDYSNQFKNS